MMWTKRSKRQNGKEHPDNAGEAPIVPLTLAGPGGTSSVVAAASIAREHAIQAGISPEAGSLGAMSPLALQWTANSPLGGNSPCPTATASGAHTVPQRSRAAAAAAAAAAVGDPSGRARAPRGDGRRAAAAAARDGLRGFWGDLRKDMEKERADREREQSRTHSSAQSKKLSGAGLNFGQIVRLRQGASRARRNLHTKKKPTRRRLTILPKSRGKKIWDGYIGLLIFYSAIVVPMRLSFNTEPGPATRVLEYVFEASFALDIVLCFLTAYYEEDRLVHSHKKIAVNYLKGWFIVDLVAAFPVDFIFLLMPGGSGDDGGGGGGNWDAAKLFKMLRVVRLAKALKLQHLLREIDPVVLGIAKTLGKVIIAAHFMCCVWFYVACRDVVASNGGGSLGPNDALPDELAADTTVWTKCGDPGDWRSMYLAGFYFITYTIMAVGYGEIHADTNAERVVAMLLQISGAALFGLVIATTNKIIHILDPVQEAKAEAMTELMEYAADRNLSDGLQARLKRHYAYYLFQKTTFDEGRLYGGLPVPLRFALAEEVNKVLAQSLSLLADGAAGGGRGSARDTSLPHRARLQLAHALRPAQLERREYLVDEGAALTEMYCLVKGKVTGVLNDVLKGVVVVGTWGAGADLGLDQLVCRRHAPVSLVAASTVDLLWLNEFDLRTCFEAYPEARAHLTARAEGYAALMDEVLAGGDFSQGGQHYKATLIIDHKPIATKQHLKHGDNAALGLFRDAGGGGGGGGGGPVVGGGGGGGGRRREGRAPNPVETQAASAQRLLRTWTGAEGGFPARDAQGRPVEGVCELEETLEDLNRRLILLPDQVEKVDWDLAVLVLIVLSSIVVPVRVAFGVGGTTALVVDAVVDSVLCLDVLSKFRTAYPELADNNIKVHVTLPGMIARRYARGWLAVDLLSSLPLNVLLGAGLLPLKLLRLLRLKRLSEVLRALQAIKAGDSSRRRHHLEVPRWAAEVLRVFVAIYFSAHLFACLFFALTKGLRTEETWWRADGIRWGDEGGGATSREVGEAYLASIYWALTTMATVGYGDIWPRNDAERALSAAIMLLGSTMFGYVVGSVSGLARDGHGGGVRAAAHLQELQDYLEDKGVSLQLRDAVRLSVKHRLAVQSAFRPEPLLARLPARLRQEVLLQIHEDHIPKIVLFNNKDASFIAKVLQYMVPVKFSEGDEVYGPDEGSQGLYCVVRGVAEVYVEERPRRIFGHHGSSGSVGGGGGGPPAAAAHNETVQQKLLSIVPEGKLFGYVDFLLAEGGGPPSRDEGDDDDEAAAAAAADSWGQGARMGARAFTLLQCFLLRSTDIAYLCTYFPTVAADLQMAVEECIWEQTKSDLRAAHQRGGGGGGGGGGGADGKKRVGGRLSFGGMLGSGGAASSRPGSSTGRGGRNSVRFGAALRRTSSSINAVRFVSTPAGSRPDLEGRGDKAAPGKARRGSIINNLNGNLEPEGDRVVHFSKWVTEKLTEEAGQGGRFGAPTTIGSGRRYSGARRSSSAGGSLRILQQIRGSNKRMSVVQLVMACTVGPMLTARRESFNASNSNTSGGLRVNRSRGDDSMNTFMMKAIGSASTNRSGINPAKNTIMSSIEDSVIQEVTTPKGDSFARKEAAATLFHTLSGLDEEHSVAGGVAQDVKGAGDDGDARFRRYTGKEESVKEKAPPHEDLKAESDLTADMLMMEVSNKGEGEESS